LRRLGIAFDSFGIAAKRFIEAAGTMGGDRLIKYFLCALGAFSGALRHMDRGKSPFC
jgi:hypothetical protein